MAFDMSSLGSLLGDRGFATTITSPQGASDAMANIKMPLPGVNTGLDPSTLPGAPAPGMWDRFKGYMSSPEGKATGYNIANVLGTMAGDHPLGQLAQRMATGGMAGLRQDELMGRQDTNLNKVLAAILGGQNTDFR